MPQSRALRTARGSAAAALATFVALVAHVGAGGAMPGPLGIVAPLILSTAVCVLLAGHRLSAARLALSVTASQAVFHGLFVLGTAPSDAIASTSGHGMHGATVISSGSAHHAGSTMTVGHAVAALITIAALYRGEAVLRRLVELTVLVVTRTLAVGRVTGIRPPVRRPTFVFTTEVTLPALGDPSSPSSLRGPPDLSAQ